VPRIIVKCGYFTNDKNKKHSGNLLTYIATREGVDKFEKSWFNKKATEKQKLLIENFIEKYQSLKSIDEYSDYTKYQTKGCASEFISRALEEHPELLENKTYLDYIATRPLVEKSGEHGLFSDEGKTLSLSEESEHIRNHRGNIFTVIISLGREDAERLSFNNATRWRDLLRMQKNEVAKQYGIPIDSLRWYGAFHNESHHPHVHMVLYSEDKQHDGYITKKGIDRLRSTFATEIYKDDLSNIYQRQTEHRNALNAEARSEIEGLVIQMQSGLCTNPILIEKMTELSEKLKTVSGKKVYGYLPPKIKVQVNSIVDELENDERIKRLYDLWYETRYAVMRSYTDHLPPQKPLSQEEAFKPIRNAIISEALKLGDDLQIFDEVQKDADIVNNVSNKTLFDTNGYSKPQQTTHYKTNKQSNSSAVNDTAIKITAVTQLIKNIGNIFNARFDDFENFPEFAVDSKLKEEIEAKKKGQNLSM